jgi:hypothetical protein
MCLLISSSPFCLPTTQMSEQPHMSPITRMERTVELIEEMKTHPHQTEILELARQQLIDMNTLDVVSENK